MISYTIVRAPDSPKVTLIFDCADESIRIVFNGKDEFAAFVKACQKVQEEMEE